IEQGETPDVAVLREIFEETGIHAQLLGERDEALADLETDVTVLHQPWRVLCEYIDDKRGPHYHLDLIYVTATSLRACPDDREVEHARFFSLQETADLKMFPNFRRMVD
ncbi:NUDIX domain-containing protein, partial [Pseudomonas viridiflava]